MKDAEDLSGAPSVKAQHCVSQPESLGSTTAEAETKNNTPRDQASVQGQLDRSPSALFAVDAVEMLAQLMHKFADHVTLGNATAMEDLMQRTIKNTTSLVLRGVHGKEKNVNIQKGGDMNGGRRQDISEDWYNGGEDISEAWEDLGHWEDTRA